MIDFVGAGATVKLGVDATIKGGKVTVYGISAAVLSAIFLVLSAIVLANKAQEPSGMKPERRLFAFSILYLFALFAAVVADRWVAG